MIFILILAINVLLLVVFKPDNRYWLGCGLLTTLLVASFIGWRVYTERHITQLQSGYWETTSGKTYGDFQEWKSLVKIKKKAQEINVSFINLVVFQTFLAFVFQIFGLTKTSVQVYRSSIWLFGILFLGILLLRLMMSISPSTGFIT